MFGEREARRVERKHCFECPDSRRESNRRNRQIRAIRLHRTEWRSRCSQGGQFITHKLIIIKLILIERAERGAGARKKPGERKMVRAAVSIPRPTRHRLSKYTFFSSRINQDRAGAADEESGGSKRGNIFMTPMIVRRYHENVQCFLKT